MIETLPAVAAEPVLAGMRAGFEQAVQRHGLVRRAWRIAGHVIELHFAGEAMIRAVCGALRHHEAVGGESAAFTIHLWDTTLPPHGLEWRARWIDPEGRWRIDSERLPHNLSVSDREHGWVWVAEPRNFPFFRYATPLRYTLLWWLGRHGIYGLHAAAVAREGAAVLLAGHGMAGKSTTAVRLMLAGWNYLGDDIVGLEPGAEPRLHCLYSSAKVDALVRPVGAEAASSESAQRMRTVWWLHPHYAERLGSGTRVRSVVVLERTATAESRLEPLEPYRTLVTLAPSTHKTLARAVGTQAATLAACARLVQAVPCYRLFMGSDADLLAAALGGLMM